MKSTAVIVNTARGELIDEAALVAALRERRIRGAALDVFEPEPLPETSLLRTLPNVFLTPHVAGLTDESARRMSIEAVEETLRILSGRRPLALVNPAVWDGFLEKRPLR
jgi:D-3-phosphoglycerate dehydrogenase